MMRLLSVSLLTLTLLLPAGAAAQDPAAPPPAQPEQSDPDVRVDPLQPDFALVSLPTTLRMPKGKWVFRITHRFTREVGEGDFGDLASDLFGLDGGAQIGLELRYGLFRGTQVGVHRTSDRTIELFLQQSLMTQRDGGALGLDLLASLEGWDNLSEQHQGGFGLLFSRTVGKKLALYAEPIVVLNTNPFEGGDDHTFMLGLGGRWRVLSSTYLAAEYVPRLAGYAPSDAHMGFGIEMRAGGHSFQINVANGWGTTPGQLAVGGIDDEKWYLGFNITRKFF